MTIHALPTNSIISRYLRVQCVIDTLLIALISIVIDVIARSTIEVVLVRPCKARCTTRITSVSGDATAPCRSVRQCHAKILVIEHRGAFPSGLFTQWSLTAPTFQSLWVNVPPWVLPDVAVDARPIDEPERIGVQIPPRRRIVVAHPVLVKAGFGLEPLAGGEVRCGGLERRCLGRNGGVNPALLLARNDNRAHGEDPQGGVGKTWGLDLCSDEPNQIS